LSEIGERLVDPGVLNVKQEIRGQNKSKDRADKEWTGIEPASRRQGTLLQGSITSRKDQDKVAGEKRTKHERTSQERNRPIRWLKIDPRRF